MDYVKLLSTVLLPGHLLLTSVAEPPLFWAALAPEGPDADSGSDQIGSAPSPAKKGGSRWLRLHALTFFILSS